MPSPKEWFWDFAIGRMKKTNAEKSPRISTIEIWIGGIEKRADGAEIERLFCTFCRNSQYLGFFTSSRRLISQLRQEDRPATPFTTAPKIAADPIPTIPCPFEIPKPDSESRIRKADGCNHPEPTIRPVRSALGSPRIRTRSVNAWTQRQRQDEDSAGCKLSGLDQFLPRQGVSHGPFHLAHSRRRNPGNSLHPVGLV